MDKEKLKKHLMGAGKMSEKDADEKLSKLSKEDCDKLAAECDEHEKKMSAEKDEEDKKLAAKKMSDDKEKEDKEKAEKLAAEEKEKADKLAAEEKEKEDKKEEKKEVEAKKKMSAAKAGFTKLAGSIRTGFRESTKEGRKVQLSARLNSLRAKAAITPAEIKRYNVDELVLKTDGELDAFFMGFENREPVIAIGQYGSAKAAPIAQLAAQAKEKTMLAESASNMPFTKKAVGKQLGLDPEAKSESVQLKKGVSTASTLGEGDDEMLSSRFASICRMMDEGKREDALSSLKSFMASGGRHTELAADTDSDSQKRLSALAERNKKLENNFEELVKMVAPLLGVTEEELAAPQA